MAVKVSQNLNLIQNCHNSEISNLIETYFQK